jgi:hypothetical protein
MTTTLQRIAEDLKHGRKVAIKVLHPELSAVIGGEWRGCTHDSRLSTQTRVIARPAQQAAAIPVPRAEPS